MSVSSLLPRVVIIGAGFGGLSAARALEGVRAQVTVIDRRNHHLFQPLLYQVATAGLSPADIATPIRSILRNQANTHCLMAEVQGVDLAARAVVLPDRRVPYDHLVIASGAGQSYFGHPEWEADAPGLKSVSDATSIRQRILHAFEAAEMEPDPDRKRAWMRFVVVGGGPTGVEMAGSIAELAHHALARDFRNIRPGSAEIVLIEAGPRVLSSFPPRLSESARRAMLRLGVDVRTDCTVEKVDAAGVVIRGQRLDTRTVIWAAGVAASPAARWLGAEADRAGRVKVSDDLTLAGHPEVFVIGDTAHVEQNGKLLPGIAPVAMQQGKYVASMIAARIRGGGGGGRPFHYIDKGNLATVGRSFAIVDFGWFHAAGFFAWITWLAVHIFYLIGFRNRLIVMLEWAWAYLSFQRGARLITAAASDTGMRVAPKSKDDRESPDIRRDVV